MTYLLGLEEYSPVPSPRVEAKKNRPAGWARRGWKGALLAMEKRFDHSITNTFFVLVVFGTRRRWYTSTTNC